MAFVKLMRLNEGGLDQGEVWINRLHVVAVVGEETAPVVRVLTNAGVEYRIAQPQGDEHESVLAQLQA